MVDNELILFDRLNVIRDTINKYGIDNFYLSFSGGKDSTVLHHLLDLAIPHNNIPRVFVNTGIEYNDIVKFYLSLSTNDDRFQMVVPRLPIRKVLEEYGYPFKSKEHSLIVSQFNKGLNSNYVHKYINGYYFDGRPSKRICPKCLKYQFDVKGKYNYSHQCCFKLKKEPMHLWEKQSKKHCCITGIRHEEGGQRGNIKGCVISDKKGNLVRFHPLLVVTDEWEDWFIKEYSIKLCPLYYYPFNFRRTGCKGCPFSLDLQEQLDTMKMYLPNEEKQCEFIWKYVYDEYRRIGYRLKDNITIWD